MLLKLEEIYKSYNSNLSDNSKAILNGVSLELDYGDNLAILGPSGSGKSTLLNIIGTLDIPDSGNIIFESGKINDYTDDQLAEFRNRQIGFIFQSHYLLPQCSVLENVLIPTLPLKDTSLKKEAQSRALELIKEVGLWEHKDKLPGTLSGGECQRVAVIRALINNPKLLLADEPTGSLDRENSVMITRLLKELNQEFKTALIVVTHSDQVSSQMNKTYELIDGELILSR